MGCSGNARSAAAKTPSATHFCPYSLIIALGIPFECRGLCEFLFILLSIQEKWEEKKEKMCNFTHKYFILYISCFGSRFFWEEKWGLDRLSISFFPNIEWIFFFLTCVQKKFIFSRKFHNLLVEKNENVLFKGLKACINAKKQIIRWDQYRKWLKKRFCIHNNYNDIIYISFYIRTLRCSFCRELQIHFSDT